MGPPTVYRAEHGGTVLVSQLWDERKLAYPINGHRKGSYWLIYFSMDGPNLVAFERQCELNENVFGSGLL